MNDVAYAFTLCMATLGPTKTIPVFYLATRTADRRTVLALAAKNDDKMDEAVAAFTRVLQLDAADPATKIHLGQIHLQQLWRNSPHRRRRRPYLPSLL